MKYQAHLKIYHSVCFRKASTPSSRQEDLLPFSSENTAALRSKDINKLVHLREKQVSILV